MRDFPSSYYNIPINKLADTVTEAHKHGYPAYVVINGEFYDIVFEERKSNSEIQGECKSCGNG